MKRSTSIALLVVSLGIGDCLAVTARAEEGVQVTLRPAHYAAVKGDVEKFRAHQWFKDGFTAGIEDLAIEDNLPGGTTLFFKASTIPKENDMSAALEMANDKLGSVNVDYQLFRKYYDGTGGVYSRFTTLRVNQLEQDLKMDVGHFALEITPAFLPENWPEFSFLIEERTKKGEKSRLSWTAVREGAVTRNIGPSWQAIDAVSDVFALKGKTDMAGFTVSGEQRMEVTYSKLFREEKNLSTTSADADKKIRRQTQVPDADLMTTTLRGEKWFLNDKAFMSFGYRYAKMDNNELADLLEFDPRGVQRSYTNPKNSIRTCPPTSTRSIRFR